jgi:hypothetical protein
VTNPTPPGYSQQEWRDNNPGYPLSALRMKHIEEGVAEDEAYTLAVEEYLEDSNLAFVADAGSSRANIHVPALTPAVAVATANLTLSGLQTVDGVTLEAEQLVLLTAQTEAKNNGPWLAAAGAWTRPTEFTTGASVKARTIAVVSGTVNAHSEWLLKTTSSIVVGTTAQVWESLLPVSVASGSAAGLAVQRKTLFRSTRAVREMADALPLATPPTIGAPTAATSLTSPSFIGFNESLVNRVLRSSNVGTYSPDGASLTALAQYLSGTPEPGPQPIRWHTHIHGNQFEIKAINNSAAITIWLNGRPHSAIPQFIAQGSPNSAIRYYLVSFGARVMGDLIIEGEQAFQFYGVNVPRTTVLSPSTAPGGRVFDVGDSITEGTGAVLNGVQFLQKNPSTKLGRLLGIDDWWQGPSKGGTGFAKTNGPGNPPYINRVDTDVKPFMTGNDVIIFRGSTNDNEYAVAKTLKAKILETVEHVMAWPTPPKLVIVTGLNGTPPSSGTSKELEQEIQAGAEAAVAAYPTVVSYIATENSLFTGTGNPVEPKEDGNSDFCASYNNYPHPNLFGGEHLARAEAKLLAPYLGVESDLPQARVGDASQPSVGIETIPRYQCDDSAMELASGFLRLSYFQALRHETVNKALTVCGSGAAGATPSIVQQVLYIVGGDGHGDSNLSLVQNTSTEISAALNSAGGAITTLPVKALPAVLPSGTVVVTTSGSHVQLWTLTAEAAKGATSLTVAPETPNYSYPEKSAVTISSITRNNTATWAAQNTEYTQEFSSINVELIPGAWYALGVFIVTSATAPKLLGVSGVTPTLGGGNNRPTLNGVVSGLTAIPATIASASVSTTSVAPYALLLPKP